jgi:uncharacterized protein (DUF433 family)
MSDWSTCPAVERDPERVSGAWVFRGTRVPVAALFENLEDGADISEFVNWFPGVSSEQAWQVLEYAAKSTLALALVRVVFDQGAPVTLRNALAAHHVETAYERGWGTLGNGELLRVAEVEGFDVFVTTDLNLQHQQNLSGRSIAIVVLITPSGPRIEKAIDLVVDIVNKAAQGSYTEVNIP